MYERPLNTTLRRRLSTEPRRFMQIVLGPRQVGKTTSVKQVLDSLDLPAIAGSADTPGLQSPQWLGEKWNAARALHDASGGPVILFLDEIQKITDWSAWVKKYWDEDTWEERDVRVVLTGSAPLLMQRGLSESLMGRFELIRATHWTWPECRDAFGWDLDTFIFFGGYPGTAALLPDEARWREYIRSAVVEATVSRDLLLLTRIDKPALLRRVFSLACEYSGRELTYEKMLGQLQDAGNTTTIAHYLDLLDGAGLVTGLQKYSPQTVRRRRSSPKFAVHNSALMSAFDPRTFNQARGDASWWGRLVESAVGAHLIALAAGDPFAELHYWRNRVRGTDREVDFVLTAGDRPIGIEVKSGEGPHDLSGLTAFGQAHVDARTLLVGDGGLGLEAFFESSWVRV